MKDTKSYLSKIVKDMPDSGIKDFFDVANTMEGALSLGVGEPDFPTPEHVREAAIASIKKGDTKYTDNRGTVELRAAAADYLTKFDLHYDKQDEILITMGASEGIDLALRTLVNPGEEVLVAEPSYVSYIPCIELCGGVPVSLKLRAENKFRLTREQLEEKITEKSKVLLISYPNNPTGAVMERKDLEEIAEVIKEHDIFVLSDEIYAELTYCGEHVSIASLPGMKERTVLINGFSKAYAMTGWRLGYACAPAEILEQMLKIHQFAIMCAPTTSQYAAISALRNGDDDVMKMREEYNERRPYLVHRFKEMGLQCFEPFGAFYIFPSIQEFGMTSEEFANRFLREEKVAVVPGTAFGACGEGFLRISYAYSLDNLKMALERLEHFIAHLREEKKNG